MRVAVSWSSGKDGALALERAREAGHDVVALVNLVDISTGRVRAHGVRDVAVQAQASALGIPILQRDTSWDQYEASFKDVGRQLRSTESVEGIVFGDISLQQHRDWGERVCGDLGLETLYPLWGEEHGALVEELLERGFEAVVVSVQDPLDVDLLGRPLGKGFLKELSERAGVSPAGEDGSYHTFVTYGPGWSDPIQCTLEGRFRDAPYTCIELRLGPGDG